MRIGFVTKTASRSQLVQRCVDEVLKVIFKGSIDVGPVGGQAAEVLLVVRKRSLRASDPIHAYVQVPFARLEGIESHVSPRCFTVAVFHEDRPHKFDKNAVVVPRSGEAVLRTR